MSPAERYKYFLDRIAQQYHTQRRSANKRGEPFGIMHRDWIAAWQCHPRALTAGRMVRLDSSKPWSVCNCAFEPGEALEPASRTLTVAQWIRELRAKA